MLIHSRLFYTGPCQRRPGLSSGDPLVLEQADFAFVPFIRRPIHIVAYAQPDLIPVFQLYEHGHQFIDSNMQAAGKRTNIYAGVTIPCRIGML